MDPVTLALLGGGSTLLSTFLNSSAQNAVSDARNKVITDERGRQQGFDAETGKLNDQSLGRFYNFGDQQTADKTRLAELFKTPVVTPNTQYTAAPLPPTGSALTQREIGTRTGIADNYVAHQGDTLANLRSFGDLMGNIGRGQAKDAQLVGQIGGFKKNSTGVENLELDNANRAGNEQKMWADITAGLGKVGLTAGLSGSFNPYPNGPVPGALGPTSVGGAPLVGATPFLNYGR